MRPALALLLVWLAIPAQGQTNARMAFLTRQLTSAKDPRVRAQTALILGASKDPKAANPLCGALKDKEKLVRVAAANALGELEVVSSTSCLQSARQDASPEVREAVAKALQALSGAVPAAGASGATLYVALEMANKGSGLSSEDLRQVEAKLKARLLQQGVLLAPAHQSKSEAHQVLKDKQLKGFLLMTEVLPNGSAGLQLKLLCMTYPDRSLKGQVSAKGSGPTAKLISALVNRVVDDTADECGWSE